MARLEAVWYQPPLWTSRNLSQRAPDMAVRTEELRVSLYYQASVVVASERGLSPPADPRVRNLPREELCRVLFESGCRLSVAWALKDAPAGVTVMSIGIQAQAVDGLHDVTELFAVLELVPRAASPTTPSSDGGALYDVRMVSSKEHKNHRRALMHFILIAQLSDGSYITSNPTEAFLRNKRASYSSSALYDADGLRLAGPQVLPFGAGMNPNERKMWDMLLEDERARLDAPLRAAAAEARPPQRAAAKHARIVHMAAAAASHAPVRGRGMYQRSWRGRPARVFAARRAQLEDEDEDEEYYSDDAMDDDGASGTHSSVDSSRMTVLATVASDALVEFNSSSPQPLLRSSTPTDPVLLDNERNAARVDACVDVATPVAGDVAMYTHTVTSRGAVSTASLGESMLREADAAAGRIGSPDTVVHDDAATAYAAPAVRMGYGRAHGGGSMREVQHPLAVSVTQ